jgi:predicted nucleic acid-binding protein
VSFLLDTNILSAHLRRPAGLAHRFFQHSGRLYTSGVSLAELYDWVNGRRDPDPLRASVQKLLRACLGISIQVTFMGDQSVQVASIRPQCSFAPIPAA